MISKNDLDKVLIEINRIFAGLEDRIKKLEEAPKEVSLAKTTTSTKPAVKAK